jgi:hypothetical protein
MLLQPQCSVLENYDEYRSGGNGVWFGVRGDPTNCTAVCQELVMRVTKLTPAKPILIKEHAKILELV